MPSNIIILFVVGAVAITTFAAGTGSILLDNVQCSGLESRLIDCPHSSVGTGSCVHTQDAGVRCQLREFYLCVVFMLLIKCCMLLL